MIFRNYSVKNGKIFEEVREFKPLKLDLAEFKEKTKTVFQIKGWKRTTKMPSIVKKIEHATGQKMEVVPLPAGLIIEGSRKKKSKKEEETGAEKSADPNQGAFHEKKASNAKDYNLGWKEKDKMYGKKYSSKKYKGYSG